MTELIKEEGKFKYIEEGQGTPLVLLHGLFGALSNFIDLIDAFKGQYRVVVPMLPLFELPVRELSVTALKNHVVEFLELKNYGEPVHLLGNSLGGHVALVLTLEHPELVRSLTLTGSSGLYENTFGSNFPQRQNYEYIKQKTEATFFDPKVATKELVDDIFEIVNNAEKGLRIVVTAKSAIRHNLAEDLHKIQQKTLLIWGKQDSVTPPFVGEEFNEKIPNSTLHFFDECGHAPMMEKPQEFIPILREFLAQV